MNKLILSVDGGGVLGIGPCEFMKYVEYYMGFSYRNPDACAGTSVGGIIAAASACKMSFADTNKLFEMLAPQIFATPPLSWAFNPSTPKYDGKGLKSALRYAFGNAKMSDLPIPLFIVAMDYRTGKPKVWDSSDGDLVRDVVATSCSAPTYFPPICGKVDGGLVANNPSMCAVAGCISKLGWKLEDLWMLSLGTNGDYWEDPEVDSTTGKLEWAKLLLTTPTRGNEELATFQTRALLRDRLLRIEPILNRDYGLDDLEIMGEYAQIWKGLYTLRSQEVKDWYTQLGR